MGASVLLSSLCLVAVFAVPEMPEAEWDGFLDWLFHYEYELLGIPAPACTVYLRVDPNVSQKLMTKRYHGNETKKDIHEANLGYLKRSRQAADYCANKLGWRVVECVEGDEMRTVEAIFADVCGAAAECAE